MTLDPNVLGAALVVGCMGLEYGLGRARGRSLYTLADSLSDIGSSVGQLAVLAMFGFTMVTLYAALEARLGLFDFPLDHPGWWLVGFLVVELAFYWRHRAGHEMHLFWTVHEVHHQSPEYNLAVAQRVGWLQWAQTAVFVLPLAILGLPAPMFTVLFAAIHFYQFVIHTQLVGRLGPLEAVLMTPSLHRVHHGRNPRYLDKNYGFTLSLFDRLFGTFQHEVEAPVYGTLAPLPSWSPLENNLRPWRVLAHRVRTAPNLGLALAVPFRHPAWDPHTGAVALPAPDEAIAPRPIPVDGGTAAQRALATILVLGALGGTLLLVQYVAAWSAPLRWGVGLTVLIATASVGFLDRSAGES